jgi:hypothetical protein
MKTEHGTPSLAITDIDNMTSNVVDEFLTEYEKTENKEHE